LKRALSPTSRVPFVVGRILVTGAVLVLLFSPGLPSPASAQDWSDASEDDWSSPPPPESSSTSGWDEPTTPSWSLRAGIGFTADPTLFLMNFEVPYSFDQYISVGPMMQVGIKKDRLIVAPTANLTIKVPDLPGNDFDRFQPLFFAGMGFAVIENDDRRGDNRSAGFLINAGFGLDYHVTQRLSVGSRMIFNFLPERTLEEKFFYAWEMGGVKFAF
jgi:hypothetical protein